jgi:hypothetical protein
MAFLYLTEQGSVLAKTGERLVVTKDDAVLLDVPVTNLQGVLVFGSEAGQAPRLFVQTLPDGLPKVLTPEGTGSLETAISPDGRLAISNTTSGELRIFPLDGGAEKSIDGLLPGDRPVQWSADGRSLVLRARESGPGVSLFRLSLEDGRREPFSTVAPADPSGVVSIGRILVTRDGRSLLYHFERQLTELYLVEGLR